MVLCITEVLTTYRPARASLWQKSGPKSNMKGHESNECRLSDLCLPSLVVENRIHTLCGLRVPPTYLESLGKRPQLGNNGFIRHTGVSCKVGSFKVAMVCTKVWDKFYCATQRKRELIKTGSAKQRTHGSASILLTVFRGVCGA